MRLSRTWETVERSILRPELQDSPRSVSTGESPLEKKGADNIILATQDRSLEGFFAKVGALGQKRAGNPGYV